MEKGKYTHSKEIKELISKNHKKWWEENKDSQLVKNRNKKLSKKLKGRKISEEQKEKISKKLKGRIFTEEHRKNLSIAGKNRIMTWGHKIVESRRKNGNYKLSNNTKEKMKKSRILFLKNNPDFFKEHTKNMEGKNNPAWLGGKSFEKYDENFNNRFKKAIRKRDNQICMLCGIHREKLSRALDVHHINYNKKMTIPQNCISLCSICHLKTNLNRKHWKIFFQSLLNEKYGYNYDKNEIVLEIC